MRRYKDVVYSPKKVLKTKSNFFLRNSDSGILTICNRVKHRGVKCTFVCVTLIFILRSNGDQGRLSRATDPYFISSVKSNRGLLLSSCFVRRLDIYKAVVKTQSQLDSGTSTGARR